MKFKRIAALTMTSALLASLSTGTLAKDTDSQTMNLRLTVAEPDTSYLLTIPADMNDLKSGWNALGSGINVKNENKTFSEKKKVKITASSANDWNLKLDDSNKISYQLKSSESATETVKEWEFTSEDLNKDNGETKTLGINVAEYNDDITPGDYTDAITFTAEVGNVAGGPLSPLKSDSSIEIAYVEAGDPCVLKGTITNGTFTLTSFSLNGQDRTENRKQFTTCTIENNVLTLIVANLTVFQADLDGSEFYSYFNTVSSVKVNDVDVTDKLTKK